jgi:hypothetical protein
MTADNRLSLQQSGELGDISHATAMNHSNRNFAQPSDMFESRHAHGRITISFIHVRPDLDCPS